MHEGLQGMHGRGGVIGKSVLYSIQHQSLMRFC